MAASCTPEEKEKVVNFLEGKMKSGGKSKYYMKDFESIFPDKKLREIKNILTALVQDGTMEYWSSGSTTMYGLKGAGKQSHTEGED